MAAVSIGDILNCARLAWILYDVGFSRAQNAERLYANFGADIQHLHQNLDKLAQVIKRVTAQVPQNLNSTEDVWDLESLSQILGNFRKTINDCHILLRANSAFQKDDQGFVQNVRWNLSIQPEVTKLRDRVAFHNIKILTMLKPLELKLLLDLRNMLTRIDSRLGDMQDQLHRIEGLLAQNTGGGVAASHWRALPRDLLEIPMALKQRIDTSTFSVYPELANHDHNEFPLVKGINAFHSYFNQSVVLFKPETLVLADEVVVFRVPEPTQYLNLMKCIWIVEHIRKGQEYMDTSRDAIWKCYIDELERKCRRECLRFTTQEPESTQLNNPEPSNFSLLQNDEFRVSLFEDAEEDDTEDSDYFNEILRVSLMSQARNKKEELVLLRYPGIDTRVTIRVYSSNISDSQNLVSKESELDLGKICLIPLYANPDSSALNMTFKSDSRSGSTTILPFQGLRDLLSFQQAITAYRVVLDKTNVHLKSFQSTGIFGKETIERGRLQIWYRRSLDRMSDLIASHSPVTSLGATHRPSMLSIPLSPTSQRNSNFSPTSSPGTGSSPLGSSIGLSTGASSGASTRMSTATFSTTFTSPVVGAVDIRSFNFQKPDYPVVVLYLETTAKVLSFLAIYVDPRTQIKHHCNCGNNNACTHITIERTSGNLQAARKVAPQGSPWNIAALGIHQQKKELGDLRVLKLKQVQITFSKVRDRESFEAEFIMTKKIFEEQLNTYWLEAEKVKASH